MKQFTRMPNSEPVTTTKTSKPRAQYVTQVKPKGQPLRDLRDAMQSKVDAALMEVGRLHINDVMGGINNRAQMSEAIAKVRANLDALELVELALAKRS